MELTAGKNTVMTALADAIARGSRIISLSGLTSISAKAFVLSHLRKATGRTFSIVADSNEDVEQWLRDLEFWLAWDDSEAGSTVLGLPSFETDVYSGASPHAETQERRAMALWHLSRGKADFVVMSAKSLITRIDPPD